MILDFILLISIIRYLRKSTHAESILPTWNKIFTKMLYTGIALLVIDTIFDSTKPFTIWLAHLLLLYLLYILYTLKALPPVRPLMLAIMPCVFISIAADAARLINPRGYYKLAGYFGAAVTFSIIWLVAMIIIGNRQQKALQKEILKTKQEEEQNKILAKHQAELEIKVAERTAELTLQKEELQHALQDLKSTQSQLIHAEKMASLGELTAGIAHEIQNPLNFVNNFSDVSKELLAEMKDELELLARHSLGEGRGNLQHASDIANDVIQNLDKIHHHGKRADAIVKGMLQHSRTSSGQKEPTDINALTDEYLRLAYHGLRAKDKTFNATLETGYDENVGSVNVVPQDIGRVILNLITNAFYAVKEKSKTALPDYQPTVWVSTKRNNSAVVISVKDNGNGIPQNIKDKIFQPFFTTKPTGQGTGLGLSLSYDIVKAHGGELKAETREGEGTEFSIQLPMKE